MTRSKKDGKSSGGHRIYTKEGCQCFGDWVLATCKAAHGECRHYAQCLKRTQGGLMKDRKLKEINRKEIRDYNNDEEK